MKLVTLIIVGSLLTSTIASSGDEKCRLIDKRADREACYVRQDEAHAAKLKADEAAKRAVIDTRKMDADGQKLFQTLHSICRGC